MSQRGKVIIENINFDFFSCPYLISKGHSATLDTNELTKLKQQPKLFKILKKYASTTTVYKGTNCIDLFFEKSIDEVKDLLLKEVLCIT